MMPVKVALINLRHIALSLSGSKLSKTDVNRYASEILKNINIIESEIFDMKDVKPRKGHYYDS